MFYIYFIKKDLSLKKLNIEKRNFDEIILRNKKENKINDFYWIDCVDPTDEEIDKLYNLTGIKKDHFTDVLQETERSTIIKGKWLFISYRTIDEDKNITIPFGIFSYENILITIEKRPIKSIEYYKKLIGRKKGRFVFSKGKIFFIYYLFDNITDKFREELNSIMRKEKIIEQKIFSASVKKTQNIYNSIINHIYLQNALSSNLEVLAIIIKGKLKEFHNFGDEFVEIYEDIKELIYMEKIQRDITNTLFDFHSSFASYELNHTMKKITGWGFIIMLPTLVSSIYGMNFKIIPLAKGDYGFFIINGIMLLIMIVAFAYLRKIRWL